MAADTRAIVCESCGKLISRSEPVCPLCGAQRTGAGVADVLRRWAAGREVTELVFWANVLVYAASIALSGKPNLSPASGNIFWLLGPRVDVVDFLGTLAPSAVLEEGEVWRVVTSAFLHAGILHIAFNLWWLRSIGPFLERELGAFRFAVVYVGSALAGSLACLAVDQAGLGASGAVFGLLGAGWAYGKRAGGTWGADVRRQFQSWAIYGVVWTLVMARSVSVPGHVGGLVGGVALGWLLAGGPSRRASARRDPPWLTVLGGVALALVPLSFALAVGKGMIAPGAASIPYRVGGDVRSGLARWPLRRIDLTQVGASGWSIGVPRAWRCEVSDDALTMLFDGNLGANLQVSAVSREWGEWADAAGAAALVRQFASDAAVIVAPSGVTAATSAAGEFAHAPTGGRCAVRAQRIGPKQWLVLRSAARPEIDWDPWRTLLERVRASIRRADGASDASR